MWESKLISASCIENVLSDGRGWLPYKFFRTALKSTLAQSATINWKQAPDQAGHRGISHTNAQQCRRSWNCSGVVYLCFDVMRDEWRYPRMILCIPTNSQLQEKVQENFLSIKDAQPRQPEIRPAGISCGQVIYIRPLLGGKIRKQQIEGGNQSWKIILLNTVSCCD